MASKWGEMRTAQTQVQQRHETVTAELAAAQQNIATLQEKNAILQERLTQLRRAHRTYQQQNPTPLIAPSSTRLRLPVIQGASRPWNEEASTMMQRQLDEEQRRAAAADARERDCQLQVKVLSAQVTELLTTQNTSEDKILALTDQLAARKIQLQVASDAMVRCDRQHMCGGLSVV